MNISAVLLAGGESHRMGQDKATLVFRGKPLWEIQLDLLRKLQPREIFLSARTDPGDDLCTKDPMPRAMSWSLYVVASPAHHAGGTTIA